MNRATRRRIVHRIAFAFWQALDDHPTLPYVIAIAGLLIVNS